MEDVAPPFGALSDELDGATGRRRFHDETVQAALELRGAAGLASPAELRPWHIVRRVSEFETLHYGEIFDFLEPGELLGSEPPEYYARSWNVASADTFEFVAPPVIERAGDGPEAVSSVDRVSA